MTDERVGATLYSKEKLTELALDAALEVERLLRGFEFNQDTVRQLADALNGSNPTPNGGVPRFASDPRLIALYGRTLNQLVKPQVATVDELQRKIAELVGEIKGNLKMQSRESLLRLRDFCVTLHSELMSEVASEQQESRPARGPNDSGSMASICAA